MRTQKAFLNVSRVGIVARAGKMALWNNVVSGFDREEETVNFGTRTIAENNGSLYETSTVATIQSDGTGTKEPHILSSVQHSKVCIAIDKSITVFEDKTCEQVLSTVSFGSIITCYSISEDGSFLFVVLESGFLYCLHLVTEGKIIFTKNITTAKDNAAKIFLQEDCDSSITMTIITKKGVIFRVEKFNTKLIKSAATNDDDAAVTELVRDIQYLKLFEGFSYGEMIHVAVDTRDEEMLIAMAFSDKLITWSSKQWSDFGKSPYKFKKVQFLRNCTLMLCLSTERTLSLVSSQTLLELEVYTESVLDFEIVGNSISDPCQILMLIPSKTSTSVRVLCATSFPGFEQKYQINVSASAHIVEIRDSSDETTLFLENVNVIKNDIETTDTIRVKTVTESIPEYQLGRLLTRRKFDAATAFAKKYNLSLEPVFCAKAALFVSQLDPWAKKTSDPIQLDTLINVLDNIDNVQYVVECCSKALIPEYKQLRKLHCYARTRIVNSMKKTNNTQDLNLLHSINGTLHKLETFHMIWGCQRDTEYYNEDTMKEWIRFSRADLMIEYKTHLSLGEMEAASLIWVRHLSEIAKQLSIKTVQDIFAILPEKISLSALWPWLSNFIPTLFSLIPDAICEVILWGCAEIKSLEQFHRKEWPQIGVDFANKFMKLLRFEESCQNFYSHHGSISQNSVSKRFMLLMQALSDIQKLKLSYRLTVFLDQYMGEPVAVSHMLLDRIHIDVIPEFVNKFLKQYMLNNTLQNDHVFSSYIQKIKRTSKSWLWCEEAPWEKKAVAVIELIENIETKLQQTLMVLKEAPVPWSSTMVALAEKSMAFDHVLANTIRTEYNYIPIKLVLKKYGYENISDRLISRIIKENQDSMVADIHELTKNDLSLRNEAFSSLACHHLRKGDSEKVIKILQTLEDDVLLYCCGYIVNYAITIFESQRRSECIRNFIDMFGWLKCKFEDISKKCEAQSDYCRSMISTISEFKSIYLLWKEFNIEVTWEEYYTKKQQILQKYVKGLCSEDFKEYGKELLAMYKKSVRCAELLGLQRLEAISLLLESTTDVNVLKYFAGADGKYLSLMPNECENISKMCTTTLEHVKLDTDILDVVTNLSASVLRVCPREQLRNAIQINASANFCRGFLGQSCSNSVDEQEKEVPRENWKLYTVYKPPVITADQVLIPLLRDTIRMQICYMSKSGFDKSSIDNKVSQKSDENALNRLLDRMRHLKNEHNEYYLLQIIKNFYFTCVVSDITPNILKEMNSLFRGFTLKLLRQLISARTFDIHLSLSCLCTLTEPEAVKWISAACKSFQTDVARHFKTSVLAYEYFCLTKIETLARTYNDHIAMHRWAQRLSKYSISYKDFLTSDVTGKKEVLQRVMSCNSNDTISLLQDFCCNFGFDIYDSLLLYLQTLTKTWNPKFSTSSSDGTTELHIDEKDVTELKAKCSAVALKIPDKVNLKNCIASLLPQVNFYHYEIFIILMDLIEDRDVVRRNYLYFLQHYTRSGEPTQIENDEWMNLNPECASLPPIAKWRLPFLLKDLWKLITPELNLKTYKKWLDMAPTLTLKSHFICTIAVKGEVTRVWRNVRNKQKTDEWALYPRNSSLLDDIKKCIEHMTGPCVLYFGTTALYYVTNHTPPGADQVAAVQECYKLVLSSLRKTDVFEKGMLEKIKLKYLCLTSEHILRTHGLGSNDYLTLIGYPDKLVRKLYTDETITQRYRSVTNHRPDINSAVCALRELHSINLMKLHLELLREWLQPDVRYAINQSITDTFSVSTNPEQNSNSDDNLLRACYILENGDLELFANFLINVAFGDDDEDYGPEARYRALYVLQTVIDTVALEDLTKRDLQTIRQYMKSLKHIGRLESLGLHYSVTAFESCSKHEIVQILWNTQSYSRQALLVIAQICIDFEIYEYSLWDQNLTKLAKLLMVDELKKIVLQVRNISTIVNSNGYLQSWQVIVTESFRKMNVNPSVEQIDNCIEALQLLHSCPIVHMLRFTDIINYCFHCQQPHLAAALIPFLNETDKQSALEKITNDFDIEEVFEKLNNLSLNGILSISYCIKVINDAIGEKTMKK